MVQSGVVFANCFFVVFLQARNLPENGVQTIVFGIDRSGSFDEWLRVVDRTRGHLRLCRGKLQSQVAWGSVGRLCVQLRGFILFAIELISVGKLGFYVWFRIVN